MHESPTLSWREVINKHNSVMLDELAVALDSAFEAERNRSAEAERARAEAERARDAETERIRAEAERARSAEQTERVRLATAESLNQMLRRLRQATSDTEVFELLAEAAAAYAERLVVLTTENNQEEETEARAVARRGIGEGDLTFPTSEAAAVASVFESGDPVTALASEAEISQALSGAFGDRQSKVYLFPLVARQDVVAVLIASGNVAAAVLELLCGAAGLKLETLRQAPALRPLPAPEPLRIEPPAVPGTAAGLGAAAPERRAWNDLSPEDQKLHLQAQRMARVKVAELRLYHADRMRDGLGSGDVYGALRAEIDAARNAFLQAFLSKSSTMVDYLHLELLRSIAHDDDRLLGENYPGPMV
jgi:hypothetical protein